MTAHEEMKALYIARAEEAAKNYQLEFGYYQRGIWITMSGFVDMSVDALANPVVRVKARGWKNASNEFIKAATEWYQKRDVE